MKVSVFLRTSFLTVAWVTALTGTAYSQPAGTMGSLTGSAFAEVNGIKIEAGDVRGDALRIPADQRQAVLGKPDNVLQLSNNLAIRRALAAEAEKQGLGKDAAIEGALRVARDKIMSDALIVKMDSQNKPKAEAIESLASAAYKANPKRFEGPAETGARHILIKSDTPDAKAKAEKVLADLKGGKDFAALAKEVSQDPGSAPSGGDLGYFADGRMVAPFQAALDKLKKPGELSPLVETQFGWHVIKLEGRKPAGVRPYAEVREGLLREAEAKALQESRLAYIQKIQDKMKFNNTAIEEFAKANAPAGAVVPPAAGNATSTSTSGAAPAPSTAATSTTTK